jgi:hypothetical protein
MPLPAAIWRLSRQIAAGSASLAFLNLGLHQPRSTPVNDARYQGTITVFYQFHPFFGREFSVIRSVRYAGQYYLDVTADGKILSIPRWMASEDHCRQLTGGFDPVVSWGQLEKLADFCRHNLPSK